MLKSADSNQVIQSPGSILDRTSPLPYTFWNSITSIRRPFIIKHQASFRLIPIYCSRIAQGVFAHQRSGSRCPVGFCNEKLISRGVQS